MALVAVVRTHFLSHIVFVFCVLLTAAGRHKRKILLQLLLATEISQTSESSRRAGLGLFRATARILWAGSIDGNEESLPDDCEEERW